VHAGAHSDKVLFGFSKLRQLGLQIHGQVDHLRTRSWSVSHPIYDCKHDVLFVYIKAIVRFEQG
jgi:hypothetical protein